MLPAASGAAVSTEAALLRLSDSDGVAVPLPLLLPPPLPLLLLLVSSVVPLTDPVSLPGASGEPGFWSSIVHIWGLILHKGNENAFRVATQHTCTSATHKHVQRVLDCHKQLCSTGRDRPSTVGANLTPAASICLTTFTACWGLSLSRRARTITYTVCGDGCTPAVLMALNTCQSKEINVGCILIRLRFAIGVHPMHYTTMTLVPNEAWPAMQEVLLLPTLAEAPDHNQGTWIRATAAWEANEVVVPSSQHQGRRPWSARRPPPPRF